MMDSEFVEKAGRQLKDLFSWLVARPAYLVYLGIAIFVLGIIMIFGRKKENSNEIR